MITNEETKILIKRIANKDLRAQEELFDKSYKYLYQSAIEVLKNREDAEDIVAEFFQSIFEISLRCIRSKNPNAYLITTIKNISRNFIRLKRKPSTYEISDVFVREEKETYDLVFDDYLKDLMNRYLIEDEKQVLINMVYYGYTYRETADEMNTSLGRVQRLFVSGIKKLKKFFK